MQHVVSAVLTIFSILVPTKQWYAPSQPLMVHVQSDAPLSLIATQFDGKRVDAKGTTDIAASSKIDVRVMYPAMVNAGTYLLFAVPRGGSLADFVGTPIVVEVIADNTPGAPPGPTVIHVVPLQYAVMTTDQGPLTMVFYYDSAPNTADSFLRLSAGGYYDGLTFHRIIPDFMIQGGDPRGDGSGGPGYKLGGEFNDRPHEVGVLSMARIGDPDESGGVMPRPEYRDSAGSQFFICLDYAHTKQLDRRYTVFGKVVDGMDTVKKIAVTPLADAEAGRPVTPPVIQKVEVFSVMPGNNPYTKIIDFGSSTTGK
jgi:cyclophilin family peptidyl-prolyl cis-trans isomerase